MVNDDKFVFHENDCDMQLWAWAAHCCSALTNDSAYHPLWDSK